MYLGMYLAFSLQYDTLCFSFGYYHVHHGTDSVVVQNMSEAIGSLQNPARVIIRALWYIN